MVHQLSCEAMGNDCAFLVRDADERELIDLVQHHAEDSHDMELSDEAVRENITEA